jgi:aspartate kinase
VTFTVQKGDYRAAMKLAKKIGAEIGAEEVDGDEDIAKVSIVGLGMKDHAGVASRMFEILAESKINIQLIATSEIKVSVVIEEEQAEHAVRALHRAFLESGAAEPTRE